MKKILMLAAFVVSAPPAEAQSRWSLSIDYVALRTNLAVPQDPDRANLNPLSSMGGGVSLQWQPVKKITLETGAIFGTVGTTWSETNTSPSRIQSRIPMLQIPLLMHASFASKKRLAVAGTVGIALSRAANGRLVDSEKDELLAKFPTYRMGSAGIIGAQVVYRLRMPVRVGIRYTHGLSSITQGEDGMLRGITGLFGVTLLQW